MVRERILRLPGVKQVTNSSLFRNRFGTTSSGIFKGVQVRTARTRQDFEAAFQLLQRRYESVGLSAAREASMRVMPYHLTANSQVFVALTSGKVVGTVTLVRDSAASLPLASSYPQAIGNLRRKTSSIGEITSLAVDPSYASPGEVFSQLTRLLTFFARAQNFNYLVAVVHPRHAKFYQHAMGFEVIGEETHYDAVEGKPGIAVLGCVNDPSRYRPRWRNHYFEGCFQLEELRSYSMTIADREYFHAALNSFSNVRVNEKICSA